MRAAHLARLREQRAEIAIVMEPSCHGFCIRTDLRVARVLLGCLQFGSIIRLPAGTP